MQFLLGLVAGLIIGWIIEWIIDWQFWRVEPEEAPANGAGSERLQADLAQARAQISALEARLSTSLADPPHEPVVTEERTAPFIPSVAPDDLTVIKGIGPVFARRLAEAGITTFEQLAQTTPDQVQEIVQAAEWQAVDPAAWIEHARELAASTDEGG